MAAYVIVDVEVTEPEPYEEYRRRVPATLERYGGRFAVRGGRYETLEGDWKPQRIVVLEFPSDEPGSGTARPSTRRSSRSASDTRAPTSSPSSRGRSTRSALT
jgi:uncharacterized protein (DUF1330 family)